MTNEEIIRGAYAAGKRRITCPVCNGGESHEEDTMTLFCGNTDTLYAHCHRATCPSPLIRSDTVQAIPAPPFKFEPRPLRAPYRLVTANDYWGKQWLDRTYAPDFFPDVTGANKAGMRVLTEDPDTCVWRLRALDGALVGHITRTKDKTIRTYKDLDRATYYWNCVTTTDGLRDVWVFEDAMSAALCPRIAVALLGTSLPQGLIDDLKKWNLPDTVLVCLDPGAEDAGAKVYNKLVAAGVPATFVPMSKDYKDMTLDERKELEETYA